MKNKLIIILILINFVSLIESKAQYICKYHIDNDDKAIVLERQTPDGKKIFVRTRDLYDEFGNKIKSQWEPVEFPTPAQKIFEVGCHVSAPFMCDDNSWELPAIDKKCVEEYGGKLSRLTECAYGKNCD